MGDVKSTQPTDTSAVARSTADEVARRSYGKLIAYLASRTRDVAGAEDALSEAFASALADWPQNGCPTSPEAWLLTAARRKMIDASRRQRTGALAADELRILADLEIAATAHELPDDRLALLFVCSHPAIDSAVRAPLMLQVVLGLDAATIASAFLVSPVTMGQRLVRAKNKISKAGIPFRIPEREQLAERLEAVLDAIYAAFAEGWTDPAGTDAARRDLSQETLFLGRLVTQMLPDEPEALGLQALMLYAESRRLARRDSRREYVPLAQQDCSLWDAPMINEAEAFLARAAELITRSTHSIGRYQLEAALQSAHAHRTRTGIDNWDAVVRLYDGLLATSQSPVVAINRALAVAQLHDPQAGLTEIRKLEGDARLAQYQPYWAALADLLSRTGERVAAASAYDIAIGLEKDPAVRRFLQRRRSLL